MTDEEYVIVTNLAKVRAGLAVMNVLPGEDYGVPKDDWQLIMQKLSGILQRLEYRVDVITSSGE